MSPMRTFELHRDQKIVAQGVEFDDRSVAIRWLTDTTSTAVYANIEDAQKIHGHGGATRFVFTGNPFERGMTDCIQDRCENTPFGSAGGLDARPDLKAPDWITPSEQEKWLAGYKHAAADLYGEDWATCAFGWSPAITIGKAE